jgi:hypothetical protein
MEFLKSSQPLKVCFVYPQVSMRAELYLEIINGDFVLCPILCIAEVENNRHSGNIRNISLYRNTLNSIN